MNEWKFSCVWLTKNWSFILFFCELKCRRVATTKKVQNGNFRFQVDSSMQHLRSKIMLLYAAAMRSSLNEKLIYCLQRELIYCMFSCFFLQHKHFVIDRFSGILARELSSVELIGYNYYCTLRLTRFCKNFHQFAFFSR